MRKEQIGDCTLYLGDCLEILPTLGNVDAVVTDPPYGLGKRLSGGSWGGNQAWDGQTADEAVRSLLTMAAVVVIWGGNYYALPLSRGWFAWHKPDAPPSMANIELAWTNRDQNAKQISVSIAATNAERVGHPTQKPLAVMRWCLEQFPDRRLVLDPFMGSGTTGVACAKLGRKFIGIEIEERYFQIACRRIEQAYAQPDFFVGRPAPVKQEAML